MKEKINPTLVIIVALFLTAFLTRTYIEANARNNHGKESASDIEKQYPYISKRVIRDRNDNALVNFSQLRQNLVSYINKEKIDIGLYFQFIPTGVTIGLNDHTPYIAASLLKLPVAIETQKRIENGEFKEGDKITLTAEELDKDYGNLYKQGVGTALTIDELLRISLQNSDNTAYKALFKNVTNGQPVNFYSSIDVPANVVEDNIGMTAENYASVLRSLYFSSYLSFEGSNKILSLLTNIEDGKNLRADLPNDVTIAQKIGIYETDTENNIHNTYSDCGIFYFPEKPYILCIMAKGERKETSEHVKRISNMIYNFIKDSE